jgi:hypothetical protein
MPCQLPNVESPMLMLCLRMMLLMETAPDLISHASIQA